MKVTNSDKKNTKTVKVELELEETVANQLQAMEKHTKISRSELAMIALKRFIASHKDYFPDDYKL